MGRAIAKARGVPSGDGRGGFLQGLRRFVVTAAVLGLGVTAAAAAILVAIAFTTARTMDAFRGADRALVQARALMTPGTFVVASRSRLSAGPTADVADVTGSIPPMRQLARLSAPAPIPVRAGKADRLPVSAQVAPPQLSPPQTVAAVRSDATPEAAQVRASAYAAERPDITGSIAATPTVLTPTVVTTKKYELASMAPTASIATEPAAPPAIAKQLAMPLPLRRPADAPRRTDDGAPDPASRTAVYDITAKTVYMPNGVKLAAHSGLGQYFDNPRYTKVKNEGPTPPNVYRLAMREKPFHGVRAIRLNPVFEDKMHGRDGMLAHSYLLGPTGESNGCVSFEDYPKFLQAFLRGEVDRMVVVPDLKFETLRMARARGREADRYALND